MELKKTESNMKETSRIEAFSDGVFCNCHHLARTGYTCACCKKW